MQKNDDEKVPNIEVENWNVKELTQESVNESPDETMRKTFRGNEEKGNPDDRDIVGESDLGETPQGREETKNDMRSKANRNG